MWSPRRFFTTGRERKELLQRWMPCARVEPPRIQLARQIHPSEGSPSSYPRARTQRDSSIFFPCCCVAAGLLASFQKQPEIKAANNGDAHTDIPLTSLVKWKAQDSPKLSRVTLTCRPSAQVDCSEFYFIFFGRTAQPRRCIWTSSAQERFARHSDVAYTPGDRPRCMPARRRAYCS